MRKTEHLRRKAICPRPRSKVVPGLELEGWLSDCIQCSFSPSSCPVVPLALYGRIISTVTAIYLSWIDSYQYLKYSQYSFSKPSHIYTLLLFSRVSDAWYFQFMVSYNSTSCLVSEQFKWSHQMYFFFFETLLTCKVWPSAGLIIWNGSCSGIKNCSFHFNN